MSILKTEKTSTINFKMFYFNTDDKSKLTVYALHLQKKENSNHVETFTTRNIEKFPIDRSDSEKSQSVRESFVFFHKFFMCFHVLWTVYCVNVPIHFYQRTQYYHNHHSALR